MSKTGQWAYEESLKEEERMGEIARLDSKLEKILKQLSHIKDMFTTDDIVVHAYCLSAFQLLCNAKNKTTEQLDKFEQKVFEESYEPSDIPNETGYEDKRTESDKPFG